MLRKLRPILKLYRLRVRVRPEEVVGQPPVLLSLCGGGVPLDFLRVQEDSAIDCRMHAAYIETLECGRCRIGERARHEKTWAGCRYGVPENTNTGMRSQTNYSGDCVCTFYDSITSTVTFRGPQTQRSQPTHCRRGLAGGFVTCRWGESDHSASCSLSRGEIPQAICRGLEFRFGLGFACGGLGYRTRKGFQPNSSP